MYSLCVSASSNISENVARVRERMAAAAHLAGRDPKEIALMAVSKKVSAQKIQEAYAAGVRLFGENRVQEFAAKAGNLANLGKAEWHMIGQLQSNKAAKAVELFDAVDSVDSVRLAERLDASAGQMGKKISILIEINAGDEAAKGGVAAGSAEFEEILAGASRWEQLEIRGLMSIPPFAENPEKTRPYFSELRRLRDQIMARRLARVRMDVLSMGMSHDFEIAIEEGSTCVRVGTAIFGERTNQD
jgi:PLP dependent protein